MSVFNLAFRFGMPIGALVTGKLIPIIGVTYALAGAGLALMGGSIVFIIVLRNIPIFRSSAMEVT